MIGLGCIRHLNYCLEKAGDSEMGRPPKTGLTYFPKEVDYYDDFKVMDLLNEYGPLGQTIYDIILCEVYRDKGYYLEIPLDKLAVKIIRVIGNRWVKNKDLVLQVIQYCADIGLLDKDLLTQNVITSVGIQRRYSEVTVRNKVQKDKFWLIDKDGQPLLSAPKNKISDTENRVSATETPINESSNQQKKRKEKESKENKNIKGAYFENPELENAFRLYITGRISRGDKLSADQIQVLKEELTGLSDQDQERIAIAKKAFASGWKSFYPINNRKASKQKKDLNNFERRQYDMESLEQQLLGSQEGENKIE